MWGSLAREMAQRLTRSHERLMEAAYVSTDRRLARILIELIGLDGRTTWDSITDVAHGMTVPLTQTQLAALLCVHRKTVERSLEGWRDRKIVTTGPRIITINDLEKLAQLAGTTLAALRESYEPETEAGAPAPGGVTRTSDRLKPLRLTGDSGL